MTVPTLVRRVVRGFRVVRVCTIVAKPTTANITPDFTWKNWLGRQDSNLGMAESKSFVGIAGL